jgi:hypothetical protein
MTLGREGAYPLGHPAGSSRWCGQPSTDRRSCMGSRLQGNELACLSPKARRPDLPLLNVAILASLQGTIRKLSSVVGRMSGYGY